MKKRLLGLLLMPIIFGGMSIVNASDTGCWEGKGIVPTTTYASGVIYGCNGDIPIITIYGDDGKGITIKAMNEGATTIGAKNVNTGSYGYHFQWGNNHGFESCYSDKCKTFPGGEGTGSIQVNVINYGPVGKSKSGYYDSGTWIPLWLWSTNNRNLWGGSGDYGTNYNGIYNGAFWGFNTGDFTVTNSGDRKGMCPQGYHIPSIGEWSALLYLWGKNYDANQGTSLFTGWSLNSLNDNSSLNGTGNRFSEDMQIPFVGYRGHDGTVYASGYGYYWSSSPHNNAFGANAFSLRPYRLSTFGDSYRSAGYAVRCFKNFYVKLPKTLNLFFMPSTGDIQEVGTGKVTENMTGAVPDKVTDKIVEMTNTTKTGYELLGWIRSGAAMTEIFDFETTPISGDWADDDGKVYFIAQWTGIKYSVAFTGTDIEGTMENQTFTYDITGTLTPNAFTKNGYTFSGWTDKATGSGYTDGQEVINLTTTSGDVITLTAEWTKNKTSGGSSGGGGSMKKDNCPNGDLSPSYYDGTCEGDNVSSGTDVKDLEGDTQDSSDKSSEGQTGSQEILSPSDSSFTKEQKDAYTFAFKNGITTMNTIHKANMDRYIKRGHLAKMIVNYVTNVLGKEIPSDIPDECLSWTDTYRESDEIKDYATKSCALGLMGINMKNNEFLPNDYVTRSQFGAVLSRILRGDKYNLVPTQEKPRYTDHLNALKEEGIMTKIDNPQMLEKRGYVMIMLMRSVNN